jgi:hypothetical protein
LGAISITSLCVTVVYYRFKKLRPLKKEDAGVDQQGR